MEIEDIIPHLNKLATLYLQDNKKKVGFLFIDKKLSSSEEDADGICFVNVQKGRRLIQSVDRPDMKKLREVREVIPADEIIRIRSSR